MSVIAVDVGTSMIKSVVFDDHGREVALARQATQFQRPRPGWVEQDMTAVWGAVLHTVRTVLPQAPDPVTFLAVTAQGDGCWLVDEHGEPTGPAILWSDGRAASIVTQWWRAGLFERAYSRNGSLTHPGLANALLAWLATHDPERLTRSASALHCGGWLHLKLTGEPIVDESDAAAPFLDLVTRRYSVDLIDLFGLSEQARLLPEVRPDDRRVSPLSPVASAELGLPAGLPVVMAPYDIAAAAVGAGATAPGQACTILGTTLCTEVVQAQPDLSGPPAGWTIPVSADRVLRAFPTLAGTEVIGWACRLLDLGSPDELGELAANATPGADGLLFLPYLSPAGERAPFLDPKARGVFTGLTLEHGRAQIARAVFEGLSLTIVDSLHTVGDTVTDLRCCGGGSASERWCQLLADMTGVPVRRSADTEVGAKGAFIVGLVATGAVDGLEEAAARTVTRGTTYQPQADLVEQYRRQYADLRLVRDQVSPIWHRHDSTGRS